MQQNSSTPPVIQTFVNISAVEPLNSAFKMDGNSSTNQPDRNANTSIQLLSKSTDSVTMSQQSRSPASNRADSPARAHHINAASNNNLDSLSGVTSSHTTAGTTDSPVTAQQKEERM